MKLVLIRTEPGYGKVITTDGDVLMSGSWGQCVRWVRMSEDE